MTGLVLAATATTFKAPYFDYHALAPEIILTATIVVVLVVDLMIDESKKYIVNQLAGLGLLGAFVPIITLAAKGISGHPRVMFGGAYVVDVFSLVFKALFLGIGYVVLLMGANYIEDGDYY
ncbi:MAG TPA: NADH-quinone oxidoreductase subunit N, partial [Acidimicrobiales bacterium]